MAEKRIECNLVMEDVWSAGTHIQDYNPLGKVPCLIMEDGGALFDSRVIVEYLDTMNPLGKLIPADGRLRAEVRTWEALADGVLDALILVRLESSFRTPEQRSQTWVDRQMGKVRAGFRAMSAGLADKHWCSGNSLSLADIAVGCALSYTEFRFADFMWRADYPNLAKLADKLSARPSFIDTAPPKA